MDMAHYIYICWRKNPLEMEVLIGNSTMNGQFSIAMFDSRRVDDLSVKNGDFHHRYAAMLPAESPPENSGSTRSSDLSAEQLSPAPKGVEVVDPDSADTAFLPKKLG